MNHHRGPRVWQVAVWRGRLRRLIAAGWQALITLRWRLLRRWRMIDPRCQGPRDAAHSWRTTARAPRRRHRCTRLVDLANARVFCIHCFCRRSLCLDDTKARPYRLYSLTMPAGRTRFLFLLIYFFFPIFFFTRRQRAAASTDRMNNACRALSR